MRKSFIVLPFIFCLFAVNSVFGQTEINVQAGVPDALFNAVTNANDGDILILTDGAVYPNSATLPVNKSITIKTADGAAAKAKIVYVPDASGEYPEIMIQMDASLTLKNIITTGQNGTLAPQSWRCIAMGTLPEGSKLHIDGWEASRFRQVLGGNDCDTVIIENCLINGNLSGAGGWGYTFGFGRGKGDYARVQNNTIMFNVYGAWQGNGWGNYKTAEEALGTLIIDHNTIYNITGAHGASTQFSRTTNVQITNNLYVNPSFRPLEYFSDKYIDFPQNADDITPFTNVISQLGPKGLWMISAEMVDSANTVIDMQSNNIYWTSDILDAWSSRGLDRPWIYSNETAAAIIDESIAYFEEEVTFVDAPDVPMFAVNAIADYCVTGNAATAAGDSTYIGETPFQGYEWWDAVSFDGIFDFREKSQMDMSYNTDAKSYTAGTDGFPLGDLNWFPDKYAQWLVTDVEKNDNGVPNEFSLSQNYPNPFNPSTKINFNLPEAGLVTLKVFNVLGQEIAELVNEEMKPGNYNVDFDASELSSGLYVYQITTGKFVSSKKMMLMK